MTPPCKLNLQLTVTQGSSQSGPICAPMMGHFRLLKSFNRVKDISALNVVQDWMRTTVVVVHRTKMGQGPVP